MWNAEDSLRKAREDRIAKLLAKLRKLDAEWLERHLKSKVSDPHSKMAGTGSKV